MLKINKKQKGFTLIELLVVIAIIAILAVVVILTLNPAELLRQARDSSRVSDFATLKSGIGLYQADVSTTTANIGNATSGIIYTSSITGTVTIAVATSSGTNSTSWGFAGSETSLSSSTSRSVGGTGWLPINFNAISSGAPIGSLPIDPVDGGTNMYMFTSNGTLYKLATKMESIKYSNGGSGDVESTDGGNSTTTYEQGTNVTGL